jgi:undecaprenyl-diphosphatase
MRYAADETGEMESVTPVLVEDPSISTRALAGDRVPAPAPAAPCTAERPCLHRNPPITPSSFFAEHRYLLLAIGAVFAFLAAAAAIANGWLLLRWDQPIQRFVEEHRNGILDTFFLTVSRFGSTIVVLSLGVLFSALTWSRCRAVSIAFMVATLGRPVIEFVLKALVGRDRPDLERMVNGHGPSFPSGHVMAAVALWGLMPLVVGLFTRSRLLWWASAIFSAFMIVSIAASRVYLGVHWPSDVTAGLLLGSFFLLGVEAVVAHTHRVSGGCGGRRAEADAPVHAS